VETFLSHGILGEIVRVAADAADTDSLAFQIFRSFDVRLSHDAMGKDIFHRTDKNEIGIAAQVSTDLPFAADDRHTAIAPAHRRRHDAGRRDVDELEVEIVLGIETRFLGKPRYSHGDARRRLQTDEFFRSERGGAEEDKQRRYHAAAS